MKIRVSGGIGLLAEDITELLSPDAFGPIAEWPVSKCHPAPFVRGSNWATKGDQSKMEINPAAPWAPRDGVELARFVGRSEYAEVAAVVVTYNSALDVSPLIDDLRTAACDRSIRLIVVDNQSSDDTAKIVRAHDDIMTH